MKFLTISIILLIFFSCKQNEEKKKIFVTYNWESKEMDISERNTLVQGSTYLSVYSDIYDMTEKTKHLLTATVSMRNISSTDSVFISKADYYNTGGDLIRSYVTKSIFIKPLETLEIVIYRTDTLGGSGANFIFDWAATNEKMEPQFEAVMIWTTGTQGISFVTKGIKR